MFFNLKNTKITLFISHFQDITLLKRDHFVLHILLQCLKKDMLEWYFFLLYEIRMHMSNSLKKWEFQLFKQYSMTCVVTLNEMNKFKYCFFNCDALSIHIFLVKKQSLLCQVKVYNKLKCAKHIYNFLKSKLQKACSVNDYTHLFNYLHWVKS